VSAWPPEQPENTQVPILTLCWAARHRAKTRGRKTRSEVKGCQHISRRRLKWRPPFDRFAQGHRLLQTLIGNSTIRFHSWPAELTRTPASDLGVDVQKEVPDAADLARSQQVPANGDQNDDRIEGNSRRGASTKERSSRGPAQKAAWSCAPPERSSRAVPPIR